MIFERITRLPWWLFAALSLLFFAAALAGGDWAKERGSAIRAVMERPSAPVVAFDELEVRDSAYSEAAFEAQVVGDGVGEFEISTGEGELRFETLIPLADPEATTAPDRLEVGIIVRSGVMRPDWRDWISPFVTGEGAIGPVLSLEGEIALDPDASMRATANGIDAAADTIWVRPYREGRAEALERNLGLLGWGALPLWGVGIFFAVMSTARFFASRGR